MDKINPDHYKRQGEIECIDAMTSMLSTEELRGYLRGNSFKYRWRYLHKNGLEDLRKARWYEDRLMELEEVMHGESSERKAEGGMARHTFG